MLNICRSVNNCTNNQKYHQPHRSLHYNTIRNVNKCKQREGEKRGKREENRHCQNVISTAKLTVGLQL